MLQKFVAKLSDKERRIFYIALIFGSLALFDRLFLGPSLKHLGELETQIRAERASIDLDLGILGHKDTILKKSKAFDKYFVDKIPDADVVNAEFLSLVEQLANDSGVNLVKSNPSHTNTQEKFIEYYANVDCNGPLKDVISFMHKVNSTEKLLKIVKFTMSPKRGADDDVNASLTVVKMIID